MDREENGKFINGKKARERKRSLRRFDIIY